MILPKYPKQSTKNVGRRTVEPTGTITNINIDILKNIRSEVNLETFEAKILIKKTNTK